MKKQKKKIFILLPDGIGLRNFAFTSFVEIGNEKGWDVVFWNQTSFDLSELGFQEIKLNGKPRSSTDLLKRAKIEAELDHFTRKFEDPIYQTYKFPPSNSSLKKRIKNNIVSVLIKTHKGKEGLAKLRAKMPSSERKGVLYKRAKEILQAEKPDLIFCTNQRPLTAIAPLTAARDLDIPTSTFIFSWDNLPKATMVVEADHYFVWSDYMKKELLMYYPYIDPKKTHITGSPQFEPHFEKSLRKSRDSFFSEYGLDPKKEYFCFSGDDKTTCPDDPQYLEDIAEAVTGLNGEGYNFGIIFRRCPVDFSTRYDHVLKRYKDIIAPIAPKWKSTGDAWNTVFPTKEDLELQINTILHTQAVINLASSMVFDFALFDKPCLYVNYKVDNPTRVDWSPQKVYSFVHFRSMPSKNAVVWLNSKEEIKAKLLNILKDGGSTIKEAKKWFDKINTHPPGKASERIWEKIDLITADKFPEHKKSSETAVSPNDG